MKRYILMGVALVSAAVAWRRSQAQNAERELWEQVTDDIPAGRGVAKTD
ncbi:MAG: DLW-39 family protein [Dermatophilus congolensis]|nr:DLW-39 family protein [Dermatophilus congolensis]